MAISTEEIANNVAQIPEALSVGLMSSLQVSTATWFVMAILGFFLWLFRKADKNPKSTVNWEHLIVDSNNDRVSPYKVGYLLGLIVGTWIIITLQDKATLTFDMFGLYLTYLLGGAGVNSFVKRDEVVAKVVAEAETEGQLTSKITEVDAPPTATKVVEREFAPNVDDVDPDAKV